jgi:hypothetical protein
MERLMARRGLCWATRHPEQRLGSNSANLRFARPAVHAPAPPVRVPARCRVRLGTRPPVGCCPVLALRRQRCRSGCGSRN